MRVHARPRASPRRNFFTRGGGGGARWRVAIRRAVTVKLRVVVGYLTNHDHRAALAPPSRSASSVRLKNQAHPRSRRLLARLHLDRVLVLFLALAKHLDNVARPQCKRAAQVGVADSSEGEQPRRPTADDAGRIAPSRGGGGTLAPPLPSSPTGGGPCPGSEWKFMAEVPPS